MVVWLSTQSWLRLASLQLTLEQLSQIVKEIFIIPEVQLVSQQQRTTNEYE